MRARFLRMLGLPLAVGAVVIAVGALAAEKAVRLPADYRSWRHVRSIAVSDPDHPMYGFHDGYANPAAVRGLRASPVRFDDGATFVVSLYEVERRAGVTSAGAKRRTVVQVKDRSAVATGGWRFAAFDPDGAPIAVDEAACFACHARAKDRDHVLTDLRD